MTTIRRRLDRIERLMGQHGQADRTPYEPKPLWSQMTPDELLEVEQLLTRWDGYGYRPYDRPVSIEFLEDTGCLMALLYVPKGEGVINIERYGNKEDNG